MQCALFSALRTATACPAGRLKMALNISLAATAQPESDDPKKTPENGCLTIPTCAANRGGCCLGDFEKTMPGR